MGTNNLWPVDASSIGGAPTVKQPFLFDPIGAGGGFFLVSSSRANSASPFTEAMTTSRPHASRDRRAQGEWTSIQRDRASDHLTTDFRDEHGLKTVCIRVDPWNPWLKFGWRNLTCSQQVSAFKEFKLAA
jgi:hypothetical protein